MRADDGGGGRAADGGGCEARGGGGETSVAFGFALGLEGATPEAGGGSSSSSGSLRAGVGALLFGRGGVSFSGSRAASCAGSLFLKNKK